MKRKILSAILVLCLMSVLAMPALATNWSDSNPAINQTWDGASDPQNGTNDPSRGKATVQSDPDSTEIIWSKGDDMTNDGLTYNSKQPHGRGVLGYEVGDDEQVGIGVWATISTDDPVKVYVVDIEWGNMIFEFKKDDAALEWDAHNHEYKAGANSDGLWDAVLLDGENNRIRVYNHSNGAIEALFSYGMDGAEVAEKFNDAAGSNNVIGKFYATDAAALAASKTLINTNLMLSNPNAKLGLYTAENRRPWDSDKQDTINGYAGDDTNYETIGSVYFALSGKPDSAKDWSTIERVGTITVTITPSNDPTLNTPGDGTEWDSWDAGNNS